jgi:tetratricopeptide (TPR) repeat protein
LRAWELSNSLEGTPSLFTVLINLSIIHSMKGEGVAAREVMEQSLELARQAKDDGRIMMAHELLGETFWGRGMFARSRQHFEASDALYNPSRDFSLAVIHIGNDLGVACKTVNAHSVWYLGYPDRGLAWSHAGVRLARQLAHPWSLAFGLCHAALHRCYRREYEEALKIADEGLVISTENDFELWLGYFTLLRGRALAARGAHEEAIDLIRQGITLYRAGGNELECPLFAALLAEVCLLAGRIDEGLCEVDDGLARGERNGIGVHRPELHRLQGELLLAGRGGPDASNTTEAETAIERALQVARAQDAKVLELRAATSLARLRMRRQQFQKAHEILAPVYNWFTEGFDTPDLFDAREVLSRLV